jgi:hypothetical protein
MLGCTEHSRTSEEEEVAFDPSPVAYSIQRRLSDYSDDDPAYGGETLDTWTCRQDGSCTSEGFTDVAMPEGVRSRVDWRGEYDPRGYPIWMHTKVTENGLPDLLETIEFTDATVRISTLTAAVRELREYALPPDYRPCLLACREQVAQAAETKQSCHTVSSNGPHQNDSIVTPVAHPKFGAVWEWKIYKPHLDLEEFRIVDTNCQQLEARVERSRSNLLSETRTGDPPVPAYD